MTTPTAKLLTTGQVARLCGFSPSAVLKWIRAGKLPAYSSPGGKNRIAPDDLLAFLSKYRMRVPPELASGARCRVLILAHDDLARQSLARMLAATGLRCQADSVADGITGCFRIAERRPHLVIVDLDMPRLDAADLCRSMKASPELADTRILAITHHPDSVKLRQVLEAGADDWVARSAGFGQFAAKLADMMRLPRGASPPSHRTPARSRAAPG